MQCFCAVDPHIEGRNIEVGARNVEVRENI